MATAKRDDNGYPTLIGLSTDGVTRLRALADPVTGYILAKINPISSSSTTSPHAKPDDNAVPVLKGVTSDTGSVRPLLGDPNNAGYILCDVLVQ